jgi:hypothetical protein
MPQYIILGSDRVWEPIGVEIWKQWYRYCPCFSSGYSQQNSLGEKGLYCVWVITAHPVSRSQYSCNHWAATSCRTSSHAKPTDKSWKRGLYMSLTWNYLHLLCVHTSVAHESEMLPPHRRRDTNLKNLVSEDVNMKILCSVLVFYN